MKKGILMKKECNADILEVAFNTSTRSLKADEKLGDFAMGPFQGTLLLYWPGR